MLRSKIVLSTVASLLSTAAFAQSVDNGYVTINLSSSALVDRAGWSESAALSLATSTTPDYRGSHYWDNRRWNASLSNAASGSVTVSSDSSVEGYGNAFSIGSPASVLGPVDCEDCNSGIEYFFSQPELLVLSLLDTGAPAIDFVHEGTVTMSGKTRGGASMAGFGESLGFVDAAMSRTASAELGYFDTDADGDPVRVPMGGVASSTTTSLFGAMDGPDGEAGLISRVYYGAELASSRGSKARLAETSVGQSVTASAGGAGGAFSLAREADDLTLSGRLKGNGLSLFQEADRAALAGGGVTNVLSISIFEQSPVYPN